MNNKENIKNEEKCRYADNDKLSAEDWYDIYDMMFFAEMAERQEKGRMEIAMKKKLAVCGVIAAVAGAVAVIIAKKRKGQ